MAAAMAAAPAPALTAAAAAGRPPQGPASSDRHHHVEGWHATYEDYLDTFLTADDAFYFDGDLDTSRALVEAGLRTRGGGGGGGGQHPSSSSSSFLLSRREWTLARRRALRRLSSPPRRSRHHMLPSQTIPCLSDPTTLPESECPLLALLARRERAVRAGTLAVVVFLRARNGAGQEVSAYVDLAARLGVMGGAGGEDEEEDYDEEEEAGGEQQQRWRNASSEDEDEDEDDGDEDAAERRAAAAHRRARDASRGMAGVFARLRPFLPLPTDLCYYNHATRRARANPTAQWQVAPAFAAAAAADDGDNGEEGQEGGRLLLRHVRDRRVLDVGAPYGSGGEGNAHAPATRTVVDLRPLLPSSVATTPTAQPTPQLSERTYLLQAVVFDHVVRRR